MNYLATLQERALSKSSIVTAKAAVLAFWELCSGKRFCSLLLDRFMKGVDQLALPKPKTAGVYRILQPVRGQ